MLRHSPGDRQQGPELRGKEGLEGKGEERDAEEASQTGPTTDGIPRRSDREELRAGSDTSDLGAWRDGSTGPVKGIGNWEKDNKACLGNAQCGVHMGHSPMKTHSS